MFYEIRRYQTTPGRRDEWVRYMENVVIPYQQSKGMMITASFVETRTLTATCGSAASRTKPTAPPSTPPCTTTPRWIDEIFPAVADLLLIDRTVVTRAVPTPTSALH